MVPYAPGTLSAKGYNGGKAIAETKAETTGAPAAVQLAPDRATLNADGEDVSVFAVSVTDAQGRVVPVAANSIHFELSGPGKILGVGNGDRVVTNRMFFSRNFSAIGPFERRLALEKLPNILRPEARRI